MRALIKYFLRGLVVVVPLAITIYVSYAVFVFVDRLLPLPVPGLGFLITIALIIVVGILASNLLTRGLVGLVDRVLLRLPFVRLLYSSTRDLLNAFVGEKRRFDKPVMVTVAPGSGAKALGFITQSSLEHLGLADHVAVYFPQSYNFAGQVLIIPTAQVTALTAGSADIMAFIVSGGVTGAGAHGAPGETARG